jgi:hypothetical protein
MTDEELHPVLDEHLCDGKLDHPLLRDLGFSPGRAAHCNLRYLSKLEQVYDAVMNRDWQWFVDLHEKPYRLDALKHIIDCVPSDKARWTLLADVWCGSENIRQNRSRWLKFWNADWSDKLHAMNAKERKAYAALPDQLTIYRGVGNGRDAGKGLSWTLDVGKAIYFAGRFTGPGTGVLFTARAKKSDVHALLLRRGEHEVVINKLEITERRKPAA